MKKNNKISGFNIKKELLLFDSGGFSLRGKTYESSHRFSRIISIRENQILALDRGGKCYSTAHNELVPILEDFLIVDFSEQILLTRSKERKKGIFFIETEEHVEIESLEANQIFLDFLIGRDIKSLYITNINNAYKTISILNSSILEVGSDSYITQISGIYKNKLILNFSNNRLVIFDAGLLKVLATFDCSTFSVTKFNELDKNGLFVSVNQISLVLVSLKENTLDFFDLSTWISDYPLLHITDSIIVNGIVAFISRKEEIGIINIKTKTVSILHQFQLEGKRNILTPKNGKFEYFENTFYVLDDEGNLHQYKPEKEILKILNSNN